MTSPENEEDYMNRVCLVCNYQELYEPPYDNRGVPSDEICPCCGFHYGFDDDGYSNKEEAFKLWLDKWIKDGCPWFSKSRKPPKNWNPAEQLK
jgi:hypothetical protein